MGHADPAAARIAARLAEGVELLQVHAANAGMLGERPAGGGVDRIVGSHHRARQAPAILKRWAGAPGEEQLEAAVAHGEERDIHHQHHPLPVEINYWYHSPLLPYAWYHTALLAVNRGDAH